MDALLFDLEWVRDLTQTAFDLVAEEPARSARMGGPREGETLGHAAAEIRILLSRPQRVILRRASSLKPYRPLDIYRGLYKQFERVQTREQLCDFINKFGPLTNDGRDPNIGENVAALLTHTAQMHKLLEAYARGEKAILAQVIGPK